MILTPTNDLWQVSYSKNFRKDIKRLVKRFPSLRKDIQWLIDALQIGETPGDRIQGLSIPTYKCRIANSDAQRGKSGGYRVLYYVIAGNNLAVLFSIYSKFDTEDLDSELIRRLIEEAEESRLKPSG